MSFYIILPSNTKVEGNKTNNFKIRFSKKLQLNSQWTVGLADIVYPHSFYTLGTEEEQFIEIVHQKFEKFKVYIPSFQINSTLEITSFLKEAIVQK